MAPSSSTIAQYGDYVSALRTRELPSFTGELLGSRLLVSGADFAKAGGVQSLANVMNFVDRETEKNILDGLAKRDPELAQEVKNLLLVFEDIINLDDRSIQRILKEVEPKDLARSLKVANEDLLARVYKNMSTRASQMLREEIEILGPTRMREVGKAKQQIVDVIRTLEENGAESNAGTWLDWTYYYESLPADRIGLAVKLEAERMSRLVLRDGRVVEHG